MEAVVDVAAAFGNLKSVSSHTEALRRQARGERLAAHVEGDDRVDPEKRRKAQQNATVNLLRTLANVEIVGGEEQKTETTGEAEGG